MQIKNAVIGSAVETDTATVKGVLLCLCLFLSLLYLTYQKK